MYGALPVLHDYAYRKLTVLVDSQPLTKREQKDRGEEERLLGGISWYAIGTRHGAMATRPANKLNHSHDPKGVPIFPGSSRQKSKVGAVGCRIDMRAGWTSLMG